MMPGNSKTSDNTADNTANETSDNVVQMHNDAVSADETVDTESAQSPADPSAKDDQSVAAEALNEAIDAEGAHLDADDPMGFGGKRMGDDESAEPLSEIEQLRAQLAEAEARADENWDRLLRLQAEMENQRKRAQNDVAKARKFALEGIVDDLLPVKDSLEMGLAAAQSEDADVKSILEGADLTQKMLSQVFEKNNILEVNPVDEKFDPEFHQAMSMQEIEGKAANTVAMVMQKGYTLNDRLVRPALVMVAK